MAFAKKKTEDEPQEAVVNLFEEEADEATDATPAGEVEGAPAEAPVAAEGAMEETTPPAPADPLAGGADALLSLFQEDEGASEDRGALLDMAGEVELADLLDDLRTVAVALKITPSAG